jgi:hypothetical protein
VTLSPQMKAARSALEIAGLAIANALELLEDNTQRSDECDHPQEKIKDESTFGATRIVCGVCGAVLSHSTTEQE